MNKLLTIFAILNSLLAIAQTADFTASPTTICSGGQIQFFDASVGAQSYSWTFAGGSPVTSNQASPIVTYATPGVYDVQLTITNGVNLFVELKVGFVTIVNNTSISLTSAPGSPNQSLCINTPLLDSISYSVIAAQNVSFVGLPAGVLGSYSVNDSGVVVTIDGTPTVSGVFNYTVQTGGSFCTPQTTTGTITVGALQTLTLTSGIGTDAAIVCENALISPITYAAGGSATNASVVGLPNGLVGNFSAGVLTISGLPLEDGLFNYTVATSGALCDSTFATGTIEVQPAPSLTLQTSGTDVQTICINSAIDSIELLLGGSATSAFVIGLPAGITGTVLSGILTITGTATGAGVFNFSAITIGGICGADTVNGTITVEQAHTIVLTSALGTPTQTVCENSLLNTISYAIGGGASSAAVVGLPNGLVNTYSAGVDSISGIPLEFGIFDYTITTAGGVCPTDSLLGSINVIIAPFLTLQTTGLENQTICENTAISTIEYSLGGGATDASVSGLPIGLSGSTTAGVFSISGTATQIGVFNYTIITIGGVCLPDTATGTITVEAPHTITLVSAVGTDNQVVCENSPLTTIGYTIGGGASSATASGLPIGLINGFAAGLDSITGEPSEFGIFNYTITTVGAACPTVSLSGIIDVTPATTLLLQVAGTDNQTVCENSTITPIDYLIGGTGTGATVIGLPTGISGTVTAGIFSITGNTATTGTFNYTVTSTGGTCDAAVVTGTLVIEITPSLALQTSGTNNQVVCVSSNINPINYTISGDAAGAAVTGLPAGLNYSVSGNVVTITGNSSITGTYTYTVTTTGSSCTQAVENGSIQIQNSFIDLSSAAYSNDQLVCVNNAIVQIQYEVGGPVTINDLPIGILSYYTPGIPNTFTIYGTPTAAGSFSYTLQSSNNCGSSLVVGNITVIPTITGNTAGSNTTICEGSDFTFIGSSLTSNNASYTYLWQQAPTVSGPWTPAVGVNNQSSYSNTHQTGTANFYRRIVSAGNCSSTSTAVTLTVNLLPTVAALNTTSTICTNDILVIPGFTATNGTFSWSHDGAGLLTNATTAAPTYTPANTENGNTVTLNYVVTSNNVCAPATIEGNYSIIVVPNPIAEAGGSANICVNGTAVNIVGTQASNGTISWSQNGFGSLNDNTLLSPIYTTSPQDTGSVVLFTLVVSSTLCTVPLTDTAFFTLNVDDFGANPSLNVFAGQDITINLGQSVQLEATGTAITGWNWSPTSGLSDSTIYNPIASPIATTEYILTASNVLGCFDQDTILVTVNTDFTLFVPNLFSPNDDGSNDFWEIPDIKLFPNSKVTVINREGLEVYSNTNYDNTWDGSYAGNPLPEATYYYHLEIVGSEKMYKGAVSILRSTN